MPLDDTNLLNRWQGDEAARELEVEKRTAIVYRKLQASEHEDLIGYVDESEAIELIIEAYKGWPISFGSKLIIESAVKQLVEDSINRNFEV